MAASFSTIAAFAWSSSVLICASTVGSPVLGVEPVSVPPPVSVPSVGGVVLSPGTLVSPASAPESPPNRTSSASSSVSSKAIWSPKATSTFCRSGKLVSPVDFT
jgi:hypothetical protein